MKHLKKLFVFVMVFAMLLPLGGRVAFAEEGTYNFVVKNDSDTGYTYLLYQMLVGDIAIIDGKQVLSNVDWGDGVRNETKEVMYTMAGLTDANRTAAKFAEWLAGEDEAVFHKMMTEVNVNDGTSLQNPQTLTYDTYSISGTDVNGYGKANLPGVQ